MWTDFNNITAEKICNQMTFLFYDIQFVYEYYKTEKQETFRMFSMQQSRQTQQ